jgi:hypothetical protein
VASKPFLTLDAALRGWIRFHEPLVRVRNRIVVATFEQVHEDLASVVVRLNERFGTTLASLSEDDAEADPQAYFAEREGRGIPLIGRTTAGASRDRPARPSRTFLERANELSERFRSVP